MYHRAKRTIGSIVTKDNRRQTKHASDHVDGPDLFTSNSSPQAFWTNARKFSLWLTGDSRLPVSADGVSRAGSTLPEITRLRSSPS